MKLTPERKAIIDAKSYEDLLSGWRFAPVGSPWFQDETGQYWADRMKRLQIVDPDGAVAASKAVGWGSHD